MRIVAEVHHNASPSELNGHETEMACVLLFPLQPDGAVLVAERDGLRATGICPPIKDRSPKLDRVPSASGRSIAGVLSRLLLSCLIGRFPARGEAMGPGCFGPSLHRGYQGLERNAEPRGYSEHAHGPDVFRWAGSHLPDVDETVNRPTKQPSTPTSSIGRFWSRIQRERNLRRTIANLSALDDRMLKDIGLHRGQIESVARWGNPHSS
jgi:uncharacterized protein YjiS (DUF1127 family)